MQNTIGGVLHSRQYQNNNLNQSDWLKIIINSKTWYIPELLFPRNTGVSGQYFKGVQAVWFLCLWDPPNKISLPHITRAVPSSLSSSLAKAHTMSSVDAVSAAATEATNVEQQAEQVSPVETSNQAAGAVEESQEENKGIHDQWVSAFVFLLFECL